MIYIARRKSDKVLMGIFIAYHDDELWDLVDEQMDPTYTEFHELEQASCGIWFEEITEEESPDTEDGYRYPTIKRIIMDEMVTLGVGDAYQQFCTNKDDDTIDWKIFYQGVLVLSKEVLILACDHIEKNG